MSARGPAPAAGPAAGHGSPTASGPGRVLVAVYGVFALAASARAGVQLLRDWHEAPVAYGLSALAAAVYWVATVAFARGARRVAGAAVVVELVGVLVVGTWSLMDPGSFPRATVWSGFGSGYGFVPLVLPLVGLAWLWRSRLMPGTPGAPGTPGTPGAAGRGGPDPAAGPTAG
ncbi:hypothetical protein [Cellulomonas sp. ATA003]|uniref:hypothetical protein n=1 Tax=Cellulomonas sp. ATA003 TaxID=3073064 RepID=UPI002873D6C4|nr:hypothetical protein [Cellulomonas sp. ATA003]WNB84475.1 hypothetical protein REH70_11550 [Cellulomonas sp. ATA003]